MGKYDDLFDQPSTGQAVGKYADLFEVVPTPQELSMLEAPEGSPQREDINRGVAGNLFAPPGAFARDPTLAELVNAALPRGVQEAQRDERLIPMAPPLPEQGAFEQGGLLPYVAGAAQAVESMVPTSWEQAREMIKPPMGGVDIEKENELGRAWRGELGPVEQAAAITGTALQAAPLLHLPFAKTPLRPSPADLSLVEKLKALPPEVPLAERITQPRVEPAVPEVPQEPLAPVAPEAAPAEVPPPDVAAIIKAQPPEPTLAEQVADAQARRSDWEARNEADRQQQNINATAEKLYNDALQEAKGPGPRDLAAESLLSMQKRVAQVTTGNRDLLAAFDRAHQMATERAEARHGPMLPRDRSTRYIDYTGAQPEFAPASAVEAPAPEATVPQATTLSEEAPSPVAALTEPGAETVINAPSAMPKNQIDALIPFNIQGNKTKLLAHSIGRLVEKAAETSNRTIDAFAGSGTYSHYIRERGLGKSGDVLNEFDPLRAITHKQIRDNPAAVGAAHDRFVQELREMIGVKPGDIWGPQAEAERKAISAYFRSKFAEFIKPGQNIADLTRTRAPVEMVDHPDLAGLYTLAQNQAFSFLPIQAELSPQYRGTLRQPGYGVVGKTEGRVQILKNYQPKTMNAPAIINAAGQRFKGLDVRRGDGWKLIRDEAGEGDFVPVDTSYLNKGLEKTANYNEATKEDARPDVYLRKVSENLLPAWDRGAKILITNNYDPIVAEQLRGLGFQINTAERSRAISTSSKELIATNFDHATGEVYGRREAVLRFDAEGIRRSVERGGSGAVSAGGTGGLAPGTQGENAAISGRAATVTREILERRKGILDRKAELTARAANGEQGLEAHQAAVDAELNDLKNNPVVQPLPPESPAQAPSGAPVAETPPDYTPEAAAARAAQPQPAIPPEDVKYAGGGPQTEVPGTVGISQARTEAELGPGSVVPGTGAEMGSGLAHGRDYINKGGDPRLPIRRANTSGMVGKNDVGIVHAELDRLRVERSKAAAALEANPTDPVLQQNFSVADDAQRAWRKELQPVLTKASDALREAHAASMPDADVGTYQGLADLMDEHFKGERVVTPEMRTAMARAAKGVKESRDIANGEMTKVEGALEKQVRARGKKGMTPEELEASITNRLETEFTDCVLGA